MSQRKRIWGWFFYDWASQPFYTLMLTFFFAPYFATVAADFFISSGMGQRRLKQKHRPCGPFAFLPLDYL